MTIATGAALATCAVIVGVLVVPFYLLPASVRALPRDAPRHILARFATVALACVAAPLLAARLLTDDVRGGRSLGRWLSVHAHASAEAALVGLLLVALLFAGPLTAWALSGCTARAARPPLLVRVRNLVVAPLSEEWIFRACMFPLIVSAGYGCGASLAMDGAMFGVAHLHHIFYKVANGEPLARALQVVGFQFCFSSIFGTIASFLVLRSGHVVGAILAHSFCNAMGPPSFAFARASHPLYGKRNTIWASFLLGIVGFAALLFPATSPARFDSLLWETCSSASGGGHARQR